MELIYCELYQSKHDALVREKRLKQCAKDFASFKGRLTNSLLEQG